MHGYMNGYIDLESIGLAIKVRRSEKKISLSELSRLSGVNKGTISNIENQKTAPTLENVIKLLTELDLELHIHEVRKLRKKRNEVDS